MQPDDMEDHLNTKCVDEPAVKETYSLNQEIKAEPTVSISDVWSVCRKEEMNSIGDQSIEEQLSDIKEEVISDRESLNDNDAVSVKSENESDVMVTKDNHLINPEERICDRKSCVKSEDNKDLLDMYMRHFSEQTSSGLPKSETERINEEAERVNIVKDEMLQINEFCYSAGSGGNSSSFSGLHSSIPYSSSGFPFPIANESKAPKIVSIRNVVKIGGRPLLVRKGEINRVATAIVDGQPRNVIVVKAPSIAVTNQPTIEQRGCSQSTPISQLQQAHFSGSHHVTVSSNRCHESSMGNLSSKICLHCVKVYNENSNQEMEKGKSVKVYFCECCNRAFSSKKAKCLHEQLGNAIKESQHVQTLKSLQCSYCDRTFNYMHSKRIHEMTHTRGDVYKCFHCEETFATRSERKEHQSEHSDERRYPCSHCSKLFKTNYTRKIHEKTHSKLLIKCSFCPKTFRNDTYRRWHEMLHTNDRPYKCSQCSKSFTRPSILKIHEMSHSGIRDVACRFCDKKFTRKEHVQRHEKIHLNDRQYQCSFCPKRFYTSDKAKRHEKIHLRDLNFSPKVRSKRKTRKQRKYESDDEVDIDHNEEESDLEKEQDEDNGKEDGEWNGED